MERSLNDIMEFDRVITVSVDGTITDSTEGFYGGVVMELVDADTERWELRADLGDGWELLSGFSGQYGYSGPCLHPSEFIGGGLERHIRETPGHYVAVVVESDCGYTQEGCSAEDGCYCEPDGWAVAYRPLTEDEA